MKSKEQIIAKAGNLLKHNCPYTDNFGNRVYFTDGILNAMVELADWLQSAESETDERIKRMSDKVDAAIKEECEHEWEQSIFSAETLFCFKCNLWKSK